MGRALRVGLWVPDGLGGNTFLAAGTIPPPELADRITNPNVWEDEDSGPAGVPADTLGAFTPPGQVFAPPADTSAQLVDRPPVPPDPDSVEDQGAAPADQPPDLGATLAGLAVLGGELGFKTPAPPADPSGDADKVPDGTVDVVLEWVGDSPSRARAALAAENARSKPRSTLVAELEDVAADGDEDD